MRRKKAERLIRAYIDEAHSMMFLGYMIDREDIKEKNIAEVLSRLEKIGIIKPDRPESGPAPT